MNYAVYILFAALTLVTPSPTAGGTIHAPIKVDGCELLEHPAKYNNRHVEVEGRAYGAFESFSVSFHCQGYLNLETSPNSATDRKYGFKTVEDVQMKDFETALFEKDALQTRSSHHAQVRLTGLFRCHYDFPDCKDISRSGDSSIVIRSILSSKKID